GLPLIFNINTGTNVNLNLTIENSAEAIEKLRARMEADGLSGITLGIANKKPGGASPTQSDETTIRYDNGVNFDAIGPTSGGTFQVAAYWPAATMAQYAGMKLSQVEFYINTVPVPCVIKIYGPGTSTSPGNLLHEETVVPVGLTWNLFTLSSEVDITGEDIWIGYEVTHPAGEYPAGCDGGPAIAGFGDMISLDGVAWAPLSGYGLDYNWNLVGYLIDGGPVATNDVGVQTVLSPVTGPDLGNEVVTIRVKNFGTASQSNIPVSYTLNSGTAVTGTIAGPLASGATFNYTFAGKINLGTVGQTYALNACTLLAGDELAGNNCKTANVTNLPPVYCDASTTTEDEYIANVAMGLINNSSGWQGGVADYTAIYTEIEAGSSQDIVITNGTPWASDIVYIWVDWNKNYTFDASEVTILTNIGGTGALFTGAVTVPEGQIWGNYRMRIRMTYSTAPTPCGNASYGEIEDYTIVVKWNWLILSPTTGTIPPGESSIVDVTFDATAIANSTYNTDIIINSNAVNAPQIVIPAQLTVSGGVPNISLSTDLLEFGSVPLGGSNTQTVTISNIGYDLLEITGMEFSNNDFSLVSVVASINPGESVSFEIEFSPSATGVISGILTISSNDPDQPYVSVNLTGTGYLEAPQNLTASVAGYDVTLTWDSPLGKQAMGLLGYNIYRDGSLIDYSFLTSYTDFSVSAGNHEYQVSAVYDEGESALTPEVTVIVGSANIAINPASFEESLVSGASVTREMLITNTGDLPLTFDVEIGDSYNLKSTIKNTPEANEILRERMKTNGLFGMELGMANGRPGGVSPYRTDDATIRYDDGINFDAQGLTSGGTFQVAVYWPAAIMAQYAGMKLAQVEFYINTVPVPCVIKIYGPGTATSPGALLHEETVVPAGLTWNLFTLSREVDITGQDIWIGYEVTHAAGEYPAGCDIGPAIAGFGDMLTLDGFAWAPLSGYGLNYNWNIACYLKVGWLSFSPTTGDIQPGESATIDVTFDATDIANGIHTTGLIINSNAVNSPQVVIPAQLTVSGGVPNISLSANELDFGLVPLGGNSSQTVIVSNTGYDLLEITETVFSNPDFSLGNGTQSINPGESAPFEIEFSPSATSVISGILT
ncbi:MAG: choice-of-anchor D domain-containing protein, partial [Bacteroidales bacterium]